MTPLRAALSRILRPAAADCGADDPAPTYRDRPFVDEVSPDLAAIVDALAPLVGPKTRILHVGVGASALARRYAGTARHIDGVTIVEPEVAAAVALGLPNYTVRLVNKHGPAFADLTGPYDLVVDNNPGSYTCCTRHFRFTMARYAAILAPGGRLVTHARGARWRVAGGIALGWREWEEEGRRVGLAASRLDQAVWLLRRP